MPSGCAKRRTTSKTRVKPFALPPAELSSSSSSGATSSSPSALASSSVSLTATRLPHYTLETYGFRVTDGVSTLAYSGDTGPSPALAEVARDADLFVCEATLRRGEDDGQPRGHLSVDEALEAHAAAGARRLLLTHRPSELPVPPQSAAGS